MVRRHPSLSIGLEPFFGWDFSIFIFGTERLSLPPCGESRGPLGDFSLSHYVCLSPKGISLERAKRLTNGRNEKEPPTLERVVFNSFYLN
jgi:hypothetical protein